MQAGDAVEHRNAGLGIATIALFVNLYDCMANLAEDRAAFLSEADAEVRRIVTGIGSQMRLDPKLTPEYAAAVEAQALAVVNTVFRVQGEGPQH